jgi:hypothetical protein
MHRELPDVTGTRVPLCSISGVEGGDEIRDRDRTVFQRPELTTKTVRNLLESQGSGNVRNLEGSSASKILWSGCRDKGLTTKSSPAE